MSKNTTIIFEFNIEVAIAFALIFSGTYLYTLKNVYAWVIPFVLLSYGIVISTLGVYRYWRYKEIIEKEDDTPRKISSALGASFIWIMWLTYGTIFRDVGSLFPPVIGYTQNLVCVVLVLFTYWKPDLRENVMWSDAILLMTVLLLFMPHPDTISHGMSDIVLFTKILVFFCLYVLTAMIQDDKRRYERMENTRARDYIQLMEVTVVQSLWVLMVSKYLVFASVIQFAAIWHEFFSGEPLNLPTRTDVLERVEVVQERPNPQRENLSDNKHPLLEEIPKSDTNKESNKNRKTKKKSQSNILSGISIQEIYEATLSIQ